MPGKIKVKILAGRNLPVMDRSGDTTDAYVELKFGNITFKTDVCRKSLNPQWNSEWYRFEVDDSELQDEPLQIRLMDHDTYSANDAIGKVYINLNPLLLPGVPPTVKNIWTLEAAMNTNAGSQSAPNIPHGYHTQSIHGFVEELVVSDDPEYKWIDKIRTPRASNEARQTLFFKLSGEVQRKIGLKALDLGGNAVIGYLQNFDLEGESGIVARGIGTAVTLVKLQDTLNFPSDNIEDTQAKDTLSHRVKVSRNHRRVVTKTECPCRKVTANEKPSRLKPAAVSHLSLTESIVQDASVRMMLALEDERGESKNILDVRRNLRKLFSTAEPESKVTKAANKDSKTKEGMAALLIKSIHSVPLEDVKEVSIALPPSNKEYEKDDSAGNVYPKTIAKEQTKKKYDSSFEENTPSSNGFSNESSIDSAGYNILNDSRFSTDEELDVIGQFKKLRRADTFPPLRERWMEARLQRMDSDTRPLREQSASPSLIKYLSLNQILTFNFELAACSEVEKDLPQTVKAGLNKSLESGEALQSEQSSDNSQDDFNLPLATSTPVEHAPSPPFSDGQTSDSIVDMVKKLTVLVTDAERCNESSVTEECSDKAMTQRRMMDRNQRFPSVIEELDENTLRDSFKDKQRSERLEEHDMLKSTLSLQSLPLSLRQLSQFPGAESSGKLAGLNSKLTPETMSKASSSIESLLQSSGNEIFDVMHKNRQRRMLDLIRIIDTKMMAHPPCHHSNNNDQFRRKRRDRACRNFNPRNLRQNLHNQFLRKRLHNHKRVKTSFSKDSPLNESMSTLRTLDSSSYNSSLESIATHDAPIQSHLCRTTESFRSSSNFITKRSTVDQLKSNGDTIEMMQLKTNDTNHSISSTPVDHARVLFETGGLVSSRSVKLLERISNLEEPESRDAWWKEVRMEVRSHARALACNVVIGYKEETSICDDVCVLNAYGTAAVINLHSSSQDTDSVFISKAQSGSGVNPGEVEREKTQQRSAPIKVEKSDTDTSVPALTQTGKARHTSESRDHEREIQFQSKCSLCHLPYNEASVPFRVNVSKCAICKRARVPDVMFTTIELPENVSMTGRGCIIQATACKAKKDLRGELNAKEISDCLPFLEYELHSLLLNKLKVKGMNAIFGLKLQVSVGERLIIGMAVGTAVFLTALPTPSIPQIASGNSWHKEEQLAEIQKTLVETVKQNREFYRLKPAGDVENGRVTTSDTDDSDDDLPDLDFSVGPRDTCVLEVDDIEDMDRISLLMDDRPPEDFHVVNTQTIPGLDDLEIVRNLQMFAQISRTKIPAGQFASMPSKYFARLLQSVYFKLRRMIPCALCDMQFKLALPEPDEIQFTVIGMALGLGDPVKMNKSKKKPITHSMSKDQVKKQDDSDMIFNLDVDHAELSSDNVSSSNLNSTTLVHAPSLRSRTRSPLRSKVYTTRRHKHNGGLSGFTHSFVMEVLAIVRAHITALGGNAMVAFFMTKCVLLHSPHKNQVSPSL
ncbi:hypothetical protein E2986_07286 [Frieseomelitta varia]|uniref:C2 domain-containing protein n=1 Tax=Frieseomelitta varia TaxID=561572 RepID=A0A833RXD6_9HYME|nr:hypothetical protein E2986_07286 [Frieseomelitta varia]